MKKSILKLLNKIVRKSTIYVDNLNIRFSEKIPEKGDLFTFIDASSIGKKLMCIKPETFEKVRPYPIYKAIKNIQFDVEYPAIYLMEYKNVSFFSNSDFIISGNEVVWDKRNYPMFSKMFPQDKELVNFDDNKVKILIDKETVNVETAFSMCGVYATVWSHFLVQYLPKLYFFLQYTERKDEHLTIILPEYSDSHVIEVVEHYTNKFKNTTIKTLNNNQIATCKKLYYIESTSMISDHETYETYIDFFVPECVSNFLKKVFAPDLIKLNNILKKEQKNKLYVVRKNAEYRNLLNIEEIENFFKAEGFLFIEPHLMSMKEKIELFYNASEVAGPYSAGFSNIQFCRPGTKICLLTNIQRSFETYLSYFVDLNEVTFVAVTGTDIENDSQSSYTIPLNKVKQAYNSIFTK
jgi:hypothetical protein